jgi:hypothetical protein
MITDPKQRANRVYDAEWMAGVNILRPFNSVADAQIYANFMIKQSWWRREVSGINEFIIRYDPSFTRDSDCDDHVWKAHMTLTIGNLCEGVLIHESGHTARGDLQGDNSHGVAFLKAQCNILAWATCNEMVGRYVESLLYFDLLTGRERWPKPYLEAWREFRAQTGISGV